MGDPKNSHDRSPERSKADTAGIERSGRVARTVVDWLDEEPEKLLASAVRLAGAACRRLRLRGLASGSFDARDLVQDALVLLLASQRGVYLASGMSLDDAAALVRAFLLQHLRNVIRREARRRRFWSRVVVSMMSSESRYCSTSRRHEDDGDHEPDR